jgi:hypothetical protein
MTTKNRLNKLEEVSGTGAKVKYFCFITNGIFGKEDEGYKAQGVAVAQGGTGAADVHFATYAELKEFEARSDIDLQIVEFVYASQAVADGN